VSAFLATLKIVPNFYFSTTHAYLQFSLSLSPLSSHTTVPGSNRSVVKQKENVFDAIKKPPSLAMEKIKCSTAATLDRMSVLQARYRQHKETMNSDNSSDKSRRTSTASTVDSVVS
jgi:hypothetical protein